MATSLTLALRHRFAGSAPALEILAGAGWSLAAAIVARGSNFAGMLICAHALTQRQFGELAVVQSTTAMFGTLAGLGLGLTTTRYLAQYRTQDPARAGRILGLSLASAPAAGLLASIALLVLAPMLATRSLASPQLAGSLAVGAGLLFLSLVEGVQTGALLGLEAFRRIAELSAWNGLLSLPIVTLLAYRYGVNGALAGLIASLALACLLNGVALVAECRRNGIRVDLKGGLAEWRVLLAFSLPSYLSGIVVAPVYWIANALLVNQPGGYPEMALYNAADRWRFLFAFVPLAVSRIAVPLLSRQRSTGDHQGYRRTYRVNLWFGLTVTLVPALVGALLASQLMSLYGSSFRRGWPVLAVLALAAVPTVLNEQLGQVLFSLGRAWTRAAIDVALAGTLLGIAWWAIPRWGALGLGAALAGAHLLAVVLLFLCVRGVHDQY